MSIIKEALEKAHNKAYSIKEEPEKKVSLEEPKKKSLELSRILGVGLVLVISGLVIGSYFIINPKKKPMKEPFVKLDNETIRESPALDESPSYVSTKALAPKKSIHDIEKALSLTGIMYTQKRPLAVINNNVWGEGDTVANYEIVKIGEGFVTISSGGEKYTIKLKR